MNFEKYIPLWEKSGLDAQGMLNGAKGRQTSYESIFKSQNNRPKALQDFSDWAIDAFATERIEEIYNAKQNGQKLVGTLCIYVPDEIIFAANAISTGLCAGSEAGLIQAEKYLPRNTCSLIKGFFGLTFVKMCPFIELSDLIVGETTCDGKKKAYDIYKEIKDMYVMEIPQCKRSADRELLLAEFKRFAKHIEELTGNKLTVESLKAGIKKVNEKRKAMMRFMETRKAENPPISGKDSLLLHQLATLFDVTQFTQSINKIADELEERVSKNIGVAEPKAPRILVTGCPMANPNWKVYDVIEKAGGIIVSEESCTGMRAISNLTKEEGNTVDELIENIVDRYFKIDCACFSPNDERIENIIDTAKKFKVDGVTNYALMFCAPFTTENYRVEQALAKANIPSLTIETNYSKEDTEQIKLRVEAFFEMIQK